MPPSSAAITNLADILPSVESIVRGSTLKKSWSRKIVADSSRLAVCLAALAGATMMARLLANHGFAPEPTASGLAGLLPIAGMSMLLLCLTRRRNSGVERLPSFTEVTLAALAAFAFAALTGLGIAGADKLVLASWIGAAIAGAGAARLALGQAAKASSIKARLRRNIAIYGVSAEGDLLYRALVDATDYNFVGLYEDRHAGRVKSFGVPIAGNVDALIEQVRNGLVDEIVIALPADANARFEQIKARLKQFPVDVRAIVPMVMGDGEARPLVPVHTTPISDWGVVLKTMEDRIIGAIGLIFAAPLFALIAIAIKLDSRGPVFFRQKRHGVCGKPIVVWKFRSMRVLEDGAVVRQATKGDARITRVGAILRKTSLDELPQLINVVLGEMSLVGPRPHAIAHNEYYGRVIGNYDERNQVRPGITGWAQINGFRGETQDTQQMAARVKHDIWYISNWSLFLDLKIMLLTPVYGLVHKNAY